MTAESPRSSGFDAPRDRLDVERCWWQAIEASRLHFLAPLRAQLGDVVARRPDAERVRLPPLLEALELSVHGQGAGVDVEESRGLEQSGQVTFLHPCEGALSTGIFVDVVHACPKRRQRSSTRR